MARDNLLSQMQHSFTSGEMSPDTAARVDIQQYKSGLKVCENFCISPQGGAFNDTGTVFVAEAKHSDKETLLREFRFSQSQAYVLEFGDKYIRFYTSGGRIENPAGTAVEVSTPYDHTDVRDLQFNQDADFLYITHQKYAPATLARSSNISWAYAQLTTVDGPYRDINNDNTKTLTASAVTGTAITVYSNFANAFGTGNVGALIRLEESVTSNYDQWAQGLAYGSGAYVTNAGGVYICTNGSTYSPADGSTPQQHDSASWQNGVAYPISYYAYWGQNIYISTNAATSGTTPPTHTTGSSSDGGVTWQFVGKKSGTRNPVHTSGTQSDGNLSWKYLHGGFGVVQITAYNSGTSVTANFISTPFSSQLPNSVTGGTLNWRMGAWDSVSGYPRCSAFYLNRLYFAGTPAQPQTIWGSNSGDFNNFAPTDIGLNVIDSNCINITIASNEVNSILWLSPQNRMLVGTSGGVFQMKAGSNTSKSLAPSNVDIQPSAAGVGCNAIPAKLINYSFLAISKSGTKMYEYNYEYLKDNFVPTEVTLLANHILRDGGGALQMTFQKEPFSCIWVVRNDGQLIGFTYMQDQKINAWHRHLFTGGSCESVACIPGQFTTGNDQLWVLVNRTINGSTKRYIEYFHDQFYPTGVQDRESMWYVQCGASLTGTSIIGTISNLGYLEAQTVVAIVNGAAQPNQTVTSGQIVLAVPAIGTSNTVVVGIPYISKLSTLPIDFQGKAGNTQAKIKNLVNIYLRLLNSLGFKYGNNDSTDITETFRTNQSLVGSSPDLKTGDVKVRINQNIQGEGRFSVTQEQPYPLNILGIITDVAENEHV